MKAKIIEELNKVAGHTVVKHIADEFADNILKILQFENLCNHPELAEMHMYDSLELMNSDSSNLEQTTEQPKEVQHISAADKSLIGAWIHLADYSRYSGVVEIPVYDNQRELFIKALQHFISTCDNSTHDEKGNVSAEVYCSCGWTGKESDLDNDPIVDADNFVYCPKCGGEEVKQY